MNPRTPFPRTAAQATALSAIALLMAACGGGGGTGTPPSEPSAQAATSQGTNTTLPPAPEPETRPVTNDTPASGGTVSPAPTPAPSPAPTPAPSPAPTPAPSPSPAPAPTPAPSPAPTPAPTPAPAPAAATVQAVPNGDYTLTEDGNEVVTVRLPANEALRVGDTVRVAGTGTARWRLTQNAQQYVVTTGLPGNVVPGSRWTPRTVDPALPMQAWSATATSSSGNRIAAAALNGGIYISQDGGASWTRSNAPAASWSAVAMAPDGVHLAAVARDGVLATSADYGLTWTLRAGGGRYWTGVALSGDGQRLVATEAGGAIHLSTDGGATLAPVAGTGNTDWRGITLSEDGQRLVAVASFYGGDPARRGIYASTDGGLSWTRATTPGADENWSFVAASADGARVAALDNGGFPWVSSDAGATWTRRFSFSNWSGVAVSGDGRVVSALEPRDDVNRHTGYVFVSTDGGANFEWYGENRWYRTVSLSFDGNWIAVGDAGAGGSGGLLYTSQGNRTSAGTLGYLEATQGMSVEVTYRGNGQFTVTQQAGGVFTIR